MLFTFTVFTIFGLGVRCVEKKMGLRTNVNGFSVSFLEKYREGV